MYRAIATNGAANIYKQVHMYNILIMIYKHIFQLVSQLMNINFYSGTGVFGFPVHTILTWNAYYIPGWL